MCRLKVFFHTHRHSGIDGGVGSEAEVGSWDVIADSGWDDAHRDAELVIATTSLKQLQDPLICLQRESICISVHMCSKGT